jgi:hypothetical protein
MNCYNILFVLHNSFDGRMNEEWDKCVKSTLAAFQCTFSTFRRPVNCIDPGIFAFFSSIST